MSQKTRRLRFAFKIAMKLTRAATAETAATTRMTTTRASAAKTLDPQGCRDRLSRPKHFSMKVPPRDEEATKSSPLWQSVDVQASFLVFSLSHHILPQSLRLVVENFSRDCIAMEAWPIRSSPPPQTPANSNNDTPSKEKVKSHLTSRGCKVFLETSVRTVHLKGPMCKMWLELYFLCW